MYFKLKQLISNKEADSDDELALYESSQSLGGNDKLAKLLDAYKSHTIDLLNSNVYSYR